MGIDARLIILAAAFSAAGVTSAAAQGMNDAPDIVWSPDIAPQFAPAGSLDFSNPTMARTTGADFAPDFTDTRSTGFSRRQDNGVIEQFLVRRTETVSPIPEAARLDQDNVDLRYTRGWSMVSGEADGVQVEFTPHAAVNVSAEGGSAEAGATVRIGRFEVRDGNSYDDDQGRWYLFAAGSGTAVGLNWVRGMDGWGRQMTHDSGSFIGDAQVGVAWRRGDSQASFGYVHREFTAEGVHGGTGIDRSATEGFVALQYSIRPDW